jgi:hypothetical protein
LTFVGNAKFTRDAASVNGGVVESAKEGVGLCAVWCCVDLIHSIRLALRNIEGECSCGKEKKRSKMHAE